MHHHTPGLVLARRPFATQNPPVRLSHVGCGLGAVGLVAGAVRVLVGPHLSVLCRDPLISGTVRRRSRIPGVALGCLSVLKGCIAGTLRLVTRLPGLITSSPRLIPVRERISRRNARSGLRLPRPYSVPTRIIPGDLGKPLSLLRRPLSGLRTGARFKRCIRVTNRVVTGILGAPLSLLSRLLSATCGHRVLGGLHDDVRLPHVRLREQVPQKNLILVRDHHLEGHPRVEPHVQLDHSGALSHLNIIWKITLSDVPRGTPRRNKSPTLSGAIAGPHPHGAGNAVERHVLDSACDPRHVAPSIYRAS